MDGTILGMSEGTILGISEGTNDGASEMISCPQPPGSSIKSPVVTAA